MKAPSYSARRTATLLTRACRPQLQHHLREHEYKAFCTSSPRSQQNRVFTAFRTPPQFHDALRLASANNTLMLTLFTTSACAPCRTITPLLASLVEARRPTQEDKYSQLAFAELELDSPDMSNGSMLDLGVEFGVTSMPTLIGFGGRRAQRVTDRLVDTKMMSDKLLMARWIDEQMKKGDPFPGQGGEGGFLSKIFGT
jgi:thiol-disulfide isomerase/thioredoxin